jgi:hypothetical protein
VNDRQCRFGRRDLRVARARGVTCAHRQRDADLCRSAADEPSQATLAVPVVMAVPGVNVERQRPIGPADGTLVRLIVVRALSGSLVSVRLLSIRLLSRRRMRVGGWLLI